MAAWITQYEKRNRLMKIPSLVLRQLYTNGSLTPTNGGVSFSLKNRLVDAKLTGLHKVTVDGNEVAAGQ